MPIINDDPTVFSSCVFLAGDCQDELTHLLSSNVPYFYSKGSKNNRNYNITDDLVKIIAKYEIYTVTLENLNPLTGFEIAEAANHFSNNGNSEKFILILYGNFGNSKHFNALLSIVEVLSLRGVTICKTLKEAAEIVNKAYS